MTDRMDIDALLIGALYGELTPADEARLTAHLESHPADRTALADLTRTRAAVRESRILAVQLDPPQSVSALLLQEAARRAPRPQRETSSWFHRFTRSFMAHPALAAAAMFVVVVGVAGTLYVRHGAKFAADSTMPEPQADTSVTATSSVRSAPSAATEAPAAAPESPSPTPAVPPSVAPPAREPTGAGAKGAVASDIDSKAYRVRLDELAAKEAEKRPAGRLAGRAKDSGGDNAGDNPGDNDESRPKAAPSDKLDRFSETVETKKPLPSKKAKGIVLRSPEPQPKELAKNEAPARRDRIAADDLAQAPSAAAPPPPPGAQPAAPAPDRIANNASRPPPRPTTTADAPTKPDLGRSEDAKRAAAGPPASQAPGAGGAGNANAQRNDRKLADQSAADGAVAEEKQRANDSVLGWAQKQREQVIAHVKSNNCRAAATAAVEIYNRAPDYYASNVATDRAIKPCLAYVNNERQREDRARAAKRSNAVDAAPSQATQPPTTKK